MIDLKNQQVLIFDDKETDLYRDVFGGIARDLGWQPRIFSDSREALAAVDQELSAVITVLGAYSVDLMTRLGGGFEGLKIISRAVEFRVPTALFSGHPSVSELAIAGTIDLILTPMQEHSVLVNRTSAWLSSLTAQQ